MSTLIKNVRAITPDGEIETSILIADGKIASLSPVNHTRADHTIDGRGLVALPGLIDDQVHFREPGLTHKEDLRCASRACALGGVTSFLEMPNTVPNTVTQAALEQKLALGKEKSRVNYGFYIGATPENATELKYAKRTPGIKIFVGSSTGNLLVDEQQALETIFAESALTICTHAEDETTVRNNRARIGETSDVRDHSRIRDTEAAIIATTRVCDLALRHQHPTHILHISTRQELPILYENREFVTAEACIHHLIANVDDYPTLGTLGVMNPSLKTKEDNDALWEALRNDVLQVVATDHAPHTLHEKAQPYPKAPSGMPGVQTMLPILLNAMHQGKCTLQNIADWTARNPARIWSIKDKGELREGYDADITLVDLNAVRTVRNEDQATKCGWSAWHGMTLRGWPVMTIVNGEIVMQNGVLNDNVRGKEIGFHVKP